MFKLFFKIDWNIEQILEWLEAYENLGPLPGIIIPMLESFIPVLPLVAIIIANAAAYDLWLGFLYSWLGVCLGSISVFYLSRRFGKKFTKVIHQRYPKSQRFFYWIESHGFTPLFIFSCFPFTPSFLVNVVSGLTVIPPRLFMISVFSGKAVMIFIVSLAGHDLSSILHEPRKLLWVVLLFGGLWAAGRWWQHQYNVK
jgi:uncharacterized membrane protein YdjX (TVP38/TMEM64 family)